MIDTVKVVREIILRPIILRAVYKVDIDGQPVKDDTGNRVIDSEGRMIEGLR